MTQPMTQEQIAHHERCRSEALAQFRMANIKVDVHEKRRDDPSKTRLVKKTIRSEDLVEDILTFGEDEHHNPVAVDADGCKVRPLWAVNKGFVPVVNVPMQIWIAYPRNRQHARSKHAVCVPYDIQHFVTKGLGLWNHRLSDRCTFRSQLDIRESPITEIPFERDKRNDGRWCSWLGGKFVAWKGAGSPYDTADVPEGYPIRVQYIENWAMVETYPAAQTLKVGADGNTEVLEVDTTLADMRLKPGQIQCQLSGLRMMALDALDVTRYTDSVALDMRISSMLAAKGEHLDPATDPFCIAFSAIKTEQTPDVDYTTEPGIKAREVAIKDCGGILRPKAPMPGHVAVLHPETGDKIADVKIADVIGGDLTEYSTKKEVKARKKVLAGYKRKTGDYAKPHDDDSAAAAVNAVLSLHVNPPVLDNKMRQQVVDDAFRSLLARLLSAGTIRFMPARIRFELVMSAYEVLGIDPDSEAETIVERVRELYFVPKGNVSDEDVVVLVLWNKVPRYNRKPNDNKGFNDRRALIRTAAEHLLTGEQYKEALTPPPKEEPKVDDGEDEVDGNK